MDINILFKICEMHKDDEQILQLIQTLINNFVKYQESCVQQSIFVHTSKSLLSKEEYNNRYAELDKKRTVNHNACIDSIAIINRICSTSGLPPFYEGEVSKDRPQRIAIADEIGKFVYDIYDARVL